MGSSRFRLNSHDGLKMLRSLGLCVAGAAAVWASDTVGLIDWDSAGKWGPIFASLAPFAINILRRFIQDTQDELD